MRIFVDTDACRIVVKVGSFYAPVRSNTIVLIEKV